MRENVVNYNRIELLVKVAKMYYEMDFSQEKIAKEMNLSRPYISKLLNEASNTGIVRVEVVNPLGSESAIEQELREEFNLKKVRIVPSGNSTDAVAKEAARYLNSIIKQNDIIGVSWGDTMYACSKNIIPRNDLEDMVVVQLCGGISNMKYNVYSVDIGRNISSAIGATPYILPAPALVDTEELKNLMFQDHNIKKVINYGKMANIAMFTMGSMGYKSALIRTGYLSKEEMRTLSEKGAVGDVCSHVIDIDGNICDTSYDNRMVGISLDEIKEKEYRIGVALGETKVDCICGALRGGIINSLITNEETAIGIMERLKNLK